MAAERLSHPLLGAIQGIRVHDRLVQFRSLPYGEIPQRFGRSSLLKHLPGDKPYDATKVGPQSIQPQNAAHMDAQSNQLPPDVEEQEQAEDCLRLTITRPKDVPLTKLPVVVFLHGGAFFLGSGERRYYSPLTFCTHALEMQKPVLFVSMNYRLGALGFLHSSEASDLMPPNNGLHDQITGFEWLHRHIAGFGGDKDNITALGQSAGGESLSLHNLSGRTEALYRRSIMFSGTPLTMPDKSPTEHQENFLHQAAALQIRTKDRPSADIAADMLTAPISSIRDLAYVGQPCIDSALIPSKKHATMHAISAGLTPPPSGLESQIISTTSYDGSISNIMMRSDTTRKDHAQSFIAIARAVLHHPEDLLRLYDIDPATPDEEALENICLFESDVGFFVAGLSLARGTAGGTRTYFQVFELGNPFEGPLEKGRFASHTWDVVALLGAYEERLEEGYVDVIREWRERYIRYIVDGEAPWPRFDQGTGQMLIVPNGGGLAAVTTLDHVLAQRRGTLLELARREGPDGADILWEGVCRRWLMKGE